jgi:hypothetical protein
MKPARVFIIFFTSIACLNANAQFQGQVYKPDSGIKIFANGIQKSLAWCGGFDNPQFGLADLNNDGKKDLVIYERELGVRTFINVGSAGNPYYTFDPQYEVNFPEVDGSMILVDYNCDGITDLVSTAVQFTLYKGYYNSQNQLSFKFYEGLFYTNDSDAPGINNCYVSPGDIPAVADIDNDGDLDFLSFNVYGNMICWYKNERVEDGLPCDSVRIRLKDKCWGKSYQYGYLTNKLHYNCDDDNATLAFGPGERRTHTGNAMCLLDMDNDGDYDLLDGNAGFNYIVYLQNGRIPYSTNNRDSMVYQDTTWDKTKYIVNVPTFPAPFYIDIDQDGKRDLLVSPNTVGENYHCILYFKNNGTPTHPDFSFQSDTFLIDKTLDFGSHAYPFFYDYDRDGRPDLFVGSDGYYENGVAHSRISYFHNTSSVGKASFDLVTSDFLNISSNNYSGASIAIGDIDNDGKADLIIGHSDGTLSYFKNKAPSNSVQPQWQIAQNVLKDAYGNAINVGGYAAPCVYDLDTDGKADLIIGAKSGYLQYYRNSSVIPGQASFTLINKQVGRVKIDKSYYGYSTPFIGRIDNTGQDYLLVGSYSGELYRYTGFQFGDTNAAFPMMDTIYSYIDSSYLNINGRGNYGGLRVAPAVADVDGDGKFEMILGVSYGGLMLYKQDTLAYDTIIHLSVPKVGSEGEVNIFPNPAKNIFTVSWNSAFSRSNISITILSATGQKVYGTTVEAINEKTELSVEKLPIGVYSCVIQSDTERKILKLVIIR